MRELAQAEIEKEISKNQPYIIYKEKMKKKKKSLFKGWAKKTPQDVEPEFCPLTKVEIFESHQDAIKKTSEQIISTTKVPEDVILILSNSNIFNSM